MIKLSEYQKNGYIINTKLVQKLINELGYFDTLVIDVAFETSPLFLKSNMTLEIKENAIITATTKEDEYQLIDTRVAGVEMKWYPAIINIIGCENVKLIGSGIVDGNGPYWYNKYWGSDMNGGMRKSYDAKNMRWACDYDCMRPRNILIQQSNNITINDVTSFNSGFWNLHILYSNSVTIDNVKIKSDILTSPSTDGIDIDSSFDVNIKNITASCNDDVICIKSGRDSDGLRVGKPSYNINIENCKLYNGFGITFGSEVSGGIYNVNINNIEFYGTDCGIRIKSSEKRKGYVRNVCVSNIKMHNVKYLFHFFLDWNKGYSNCQIPNDYDGTIMPYYAYLLEETKGTNTSVHDFKISNVTSNYDSNYEGINRIFTVYGYPDSYIYNINIDNANIKAKEYGLIKYARNIVITNSNISYETKYISANDDYDNR